MYICIFVNVGTPIQNNLDELYTLMDWATNGKLLGTRPRFLTQFINPILAGQNPKADTQAKLQSQESAMELKRLIHPVFLQRKKLLVNAMETEMKLTNKSEVTVWIPLSTTQRQL